MAKGKLRKHKEGRRGCTVWVQERTPGGSLYVRWRQHGNWTWECLGHDDWDLAIEHAADLADSLRRTRASAAVGVVPLAHLFARYELEESVHKVVEKEDRRRMDIWQAFLGDDFDPAQLTPGIVRQYIRERQAGRIEVEGRKLAKSPSDTTVGNDIRFLKAVLSWAAGEGIIPANPIRDFPAPKNRNPKRPVATFDRFLAVRPHCEGLFGPFMDLLEGLGWRVSAIRHLQARDLDLSARPGAPHGRILKREETDKMGVEQWVPMSRSVREAIDTILKLNPVAGEAYLFPAPKAEGKPWGQRYTWGLLRKAERAAKVEHLERGAFHPYRRKWVRERKHLPRADVAAAGGWLSVQTLDIYDGADDQTLLEVVSETRKLREAK